MHILSCFTAFTLILTSFLGAEIVDQSTGASFPDQVTISYKDKEHILKATGVATRKKFFVRVYSIAHYMEDSNTLPSGTDKFTAVLNSPKIKQLISKWDRSVNQKRVVDAYRESFKKTLSSSEYSALQTDIDTYLSYFGSVNKGDNYTLTWFPDGMLTVEINGEEKGVIQNPQFARALWGIWVGPKSVVSRNELIK